MATRGRGRPRRQGQTRRPDPAVRRLEPPPPPSHCGLPRLSTPGRKAGLSSRARSWLERIGDIDGAIARFSRAAQIGPRNWAYHFNLAHALAQRQSWDRAIGEYRIAAGLYPTDGATQCNLATALQKKGDDAAAIPVFERAVQLAPAEPTCHLALATSLEKEGRDADARREYQQYLELAPSAPDADAVKSHLASLGAGRS
jgi:Flp pilus assembly protein TadD